jgi:hypothetical protein
MNVEIGAEAALFPDKEYINGTFVAVYGTIGYCIFFFNQWSSTACSWHSSPHFLRWVDPPPTAQRYRSAPFCKKSASQQQLNLSVPLADEYDLSDFNVFHRKIKLS